MKNKNRLKKRRKKKRKRRRGGKEEEKEEEEGVPAHTQTLLLEVHSLHITLKPCECRRDGCVLSRMRTMLGASVTSVPYMLLC